MSEESKGIAMNLRDFMGENLQKNFEKNYDILINYCLDKNREDFTEEEEKAWAFMDILYAIKTKHPALAHIIGLVISKSMRMNKNLEKQNETQTQ